MTDVPKTTVYRALKSYQRSLLRSERKKDRLTAPSHDPYPSICTPEKKNDSEYDDPEVEQIVEYLKDGLQDPPERTSLSLEANQKKYQWEDVDLLKIQDFPFSNFF